MSHHTRENAHVQKIVASALLVAPGRMCNSQGAAGDQEHIVDFTLGELEGRLDKAEFVRVHRSNIVNVRSIREIVKWFGGKLKVKLKDKTQTELVVSRGYAEQIRTL